MSHPRVLVFTGTRAEYGLLRPVLFRLKNHKELELQVLVSGSHLSLEHGLTVDEINKDGFTISDSVDMLMHGEGSQVIAKSMGLAMIGFAQSLQRLNPDLVIILGDRYEGLAIVTTAYTMQKPVAHLHGGEVSFGALDEGYRHAITKLSQLHFTSTKAYANRVIQLGENPQRVFHVGALGVENALNTPLLEKPKLMRKWQIPFNTDYLFCTFHPQTTNVQESLQHFENLLALIQEQKLNCIFSYANADQAGNQINYKIKQFCKEHPQNAFARPSFGVEDFMAFVRHARAFVGNSSSGIIEAPSLETASVNIGDRQRGRIAATSVFHASGSKASINESLNRALQYQGPFENPYGQGNTSQKIVEKVEEFLIQPSSIMKEFYDVS